MDTHKPLVVVTRDPDYANDYRTFGGQVETYDIDMGRMDLNDKDEAVEWAAGHLDEVLRWRAEGRNDVADFVEGVVAEAVSYEAFNAARALAEYDFNTNNR